MSHKVCANVEVAVPRYVIKAIIIIIINTIMTNTIIIISFISITLINSIHPKEFVFPCRQVCAQTAVAVSTPGAIAVASPAVAVIGGLGGLGGLGGAIVY